jgi:tetratricopeptide (TPR) repeat protein|nr:MAG TPA: Tetratricopeptide repeat [Bacteriophage sp.]DAR34590.1 MAG TPA: Tetratricopeptide repeat [Caudoviricetes sp.]
MIYCGKKQERTESDKRSVSMFSMACRLQDEQRYDEAIEAYWESIRLIDKDMRSTQAFLRLGLLYDERGDFENMKHVLELAIEYSDYFNQKEANELILMFPEYKDDILLSLETNENLYPSPYWNEYNPLWRPNNTILLIDLLEYAKRKYLFADRR